MATINTLDDLKAVNTIHENVERVRAALDHLKRNYPDDVARILAGIGYSLVCQLHTYGITDADRAEFERVWGVRDLP